MDNNIISKILADYPDAWKDAKRFKTLLLDFLPEDKRLRNLIVISVEERIPDDIFQSKSEDALQENAYVKRLVNAVGCSNDDARIVVKLWSSAILHSSRESSAEKNYGLLENINNPLIEELELPTSAYYSLKRVGIERVSDLRKMSEDDILSIRGCGRKTVVFIQDRLSALGYSLKNTETSRKSERILSNDTMEYSEIDQRKMDRIKLKLMQLAVENKTAKRSKRECADILSRIVEKELFDN